MKAAFIWFKNTVNTLILWCYYGLSFAAQETFLIIINIENSCLLNFFVEIVMHFVLDWVERSKGHIIYLK